MLLWTCENPDKNVKSPAYVSTTGVTLKEILSAFGEYLAEQGYKITVTGNLQLPIGAVTIDCSAPITIVDSTAVITQDNTSGSMYKKTILFTILFLMKLHL